jgi:hypothetical protein
MTGSIDQLVFCSRGVEGGGVILGTVTVRAKGDGGWEQEAGSVGGLGGAGLGWFCGGWLDGAALKLKWRGQLSRSMSYILQDVQV